MTTPPYSPPSPARQEVWREERRTEEWVALVLRFHGADAVDGHALSVADCERLASLACDVLGFDERETDCPCGGTRWTDDENWEPSFRGDRPQPGGAGRLPCGFCNHGGWDIDDPGPEGA